jgi:hypothetical protein
MNKEDNNFKRGSRGLFKNIGLALAKETGKQEGCQ